MFCKATDVWNLIKCDTLFSALQDANEALRINEDWPKGHFRKGKALVGLQVCVHTDTDSLYFYSLPQYTLHCSLLTLLYHLYFFQKYEEAEECFKMAVKHDPGYTDAVEQLQATQIKRLMVELIIIISSGQLFIA